MAVIYFYLLVTTAVLTIGGLIADILEKIIW